MSKSKPNKVKHTPTVKAAFEDAASKALRAAALKADVVTLKHEWINQIHALQAVVVTDLEAKGKGYWVRQREKGSITDHINADMPIVGLVYKNQLLAMALLTYPDNHSAINTGGYPVEYPDQTVIVQSFIVHPALQGKGAGSRLMNRIEHEAAAQGRPVVVARVATDNGESTDAFRHAKFKRTGGIESFASKKHPDGIYLAQHWQKVVEKQAKRVKPAAHIKQSHDESKPTTWKGLHL